LFYSCVEPAEKKPSGTNLKSVQDSALNYNHQVVRAEIMEIDDFILRYHWEMTRTPTGLRYMIYRKGVGSTVRQGDNVAINYKINLLNGDLVFQSDSMSVVTFEIGKRKMISGLEEGIMLMNKGSRAKLIIPSHLAYGLLGDLATIPAGSVLVCDVEIYAIDRSDN